MKTDNSKSDAFDGVYAVFSKRLRNKAKKLDKIKETEKKLKSGTKITADQEQMLAGKERLLNQIHDLEDMQKAVKIELTEFSRKDAHLKKQQLAASEMNSLEKGVKLIADACLVNSIHQNFEKTTLTEEQHTALETALIAITAATGQSEVVNYPRIKEGFVQLFLSLVTNSKELIPGTSVSFT